MTTRKIWTPAEVSLLTEMWIVGRSSGTIALKLGVSRSAVMGKVHRLGLFGEKRAEGAAFAPVPKGTFSGKKDRSHRWTDEMLTEKWADRKKRNAR